jgi:hypothetical protein
VLSSTLGEAPCAPNAREIEHEQFKIGQVEKTTLQGKAI